MDGVPGLWEGQALSVMICSPLLRRLSEEVSNLCQLLQSNVCFCQEPQRYPSCMERLSAQVCVQVVQRISLIWEWI